MVRKLTALLALVLSLGLAVIPAAAQSVTSDDASEIGMESGFMRVYMADPSAATADSEVLGVMVAGFEFDEASTAEDSFEEFSCGFAGGFMGTEDVSNCDDLADAGFTVSDVDGIGDQAIEVTGEADISGPTPVTMLAVQSDNYLFVVITLGTDEAGASDDMAKFIADADPSDAEVEFSEDGTSTGGFYDMLPQEGDAEVEGLLPVSDMDFLGTATPADGESTPAN